MTKMTKITNGKFIVIEGSDASGKMTQVKKLEKKLNDMVIKTKIYDFPDYESSFGSLISQYLKLSFIIFQKYPLKS